MEAVAAGLYQELAHQETLDHLDHQDLVVRLAILDPQDPTDRREILDLVD